MGNKNIKSTKLMAIVLAFVMTFSICPFNVFAEIGDVLIETSDNAQAEEQEVVVEETTDSALEEATVAEENAATVEINASDLEFNPNFEQVCSSIHDSDVYMNKIVELKAQMEALRNAGKGCEDAEYEALETLYCDIMNKHVQNCEICLEQINPNGSYAEVIYGPMPSDGGFEINAGPVVTDQVNYDIYLNVDETRTDDPAPLKAAIEKYLDKLNTANGTSSTYRIETNAAKIDPTDMKIWELYDHYDTAWYTNETAWKNSYPKPTGSGDLPTNWYYFGYGEANATAGYTKNATANFGAGAGKLTIANLLQKTSATDWLKVAKLREHIYAYKDGNGKPAMQFYGYGTPGYADFLYYPASATSTKKVNFDVDASNVVLHSMSSAGFLINTGVSNPGTASAALSGYLVYFVYSGSTTATGYSGVYLYKINNMPITTMHHASATVVANSSYVTLVTTASAANRPFYSQSHVEMDITGTTLKVTFAPSNNTTNKTTVFNTTLIDTGLGGFGPFVQYTSHDCEDTSAFTYSNLEMEFKEPMSVDSVLAPYQYADYLKDSDQTFFINLTNTSNKDYPNNGAEQAADLAYLGLITSDETVILTDEDVSGSDSTFAKHYNGTNVKNVENAADVSDANIASLYTGSDATEKLAAKLAYLIYNTTWDPDGLNKGDQPSTPTSIAVANIFLKDENNKQANQVLKELVTTEKVYLDTSSGVNIAGLTATYTMLAPDGSKMPTATIKTDATGTYFTVDSTWKAGEYKVKVTYAPSGNITTVIPAETKFKVLTDTTAPTPAIASNARGVINLNLTNTASTGDNPYTSDLVSYAVVINKSATKPSAPAAANRTALAATATTVVANWPTGTTGTGCYAHVFLWDEAGNVGYVASSAFTIAPEAYFSDPANADTYTAQAPYTGDTVKATFIDPAGELVSYKVGHKAADGTITWSNDIPFTTQMVFETPDITVGYDTKDLIVETYKAGNVKASSISIPTVLVKSPDVSITQPANPDSYTPADPYKGTDIKITVKDESATGDIKDYVIGYEDLNGDITWQTPVSLTSQTYPYVSPDLTVPLYTKGIHIKIRDNAGNTLDQDYIPVFYNKLTQTFSGTPTYVLEMGVDQNGVTLDTANTTTFDANAVRPNPLVKWAISGATSKIGLSGGVVTPLAVTAAGETIKIIASADETSTHFGITKDISITVVNPIDVTLTTKNLVTTGVTVTPTYSEGAYGSNAATRTLQYRKQGDATWTTVSTANWDWSTDYTLSFTGMPYDTTYEMRLALSDNRPGTATTAEDVITFKTPKLITASMSIENADGSTLSSIQRELIAAGSPTKVYLDATGGTNISGLTPVYTVTSPSGSTMNPSAFKTDATGTYFEVDNNKTNWPAGQYTAGVTYTVTGMNVVVPASANFTILEDITAPTPTITKNALCETAVNFNNVASTGANSFTSDLKYFKVVVTNSATKPAAPAVADRIAIAANATSGTDIWTKGVEGTDCYAHVFLWDAAGNEGYVMSSKFAIVQTANFFDPADPSNPNLKNPYENLAIKAEIIDPLGTLKEYRVGFEGADGSIKWQSLVTIPEQIVYDTASITIPYETKAVHLQTYRDNGSKASDISLPTVFLRLPVVEFVEPANPDSYTDENPFEGDLKVLVKDEDKIGILKEYRVGYVDKAGNTNWQQPVSLPDDQAAIEIPDIEIPNYVKGAYIQIFDKDGTMIDEIFVPTFYNKLAQEIKGSDSYALEIGLDDAGVSLDTINNTVFNGDAELPGPLYWTLVTETDKVELVNGVIIPKKYTAADEEIIIMAKVDETETHFGATKQIKVKVVPTITAAITPIVAYDSTGITVKPTISEGGHSYDDATRALEYRKAGDANWTAISNDKWDFGADYKLNFAGLAAGSDYEMRVSVKDNRSGNPSIATETIKFSTAKDGSDNGKGNGAGAVKVAVAPPSGEDYAVDGEFNITLRDGDVILTSVTHKVAAGEEHGFSLDLTGLPDGDYTITTTSPNGSIITERVVIKNGQTTPDPVKMKIGSAKKDTELVLLNKTTPRISVNGLNEIYDFFSSTPVADTTKGLTAEENAIIASPGSEALVELKVEGVPAATSGPFANELKKVDEMSVGYTKLLVTDITLHKTIKEEFKSAVTTQMKESGSLLTISVPLTSVSKNYKVFRVHEGVAEKLGEGINYANADGEYFEKTNDRRAILHVNKFSLYVFSYDLGSSDDRFTDQGDYSKGGSGSGGGNSDNDADKDKEKDNSDIWKSVEDALNNKGTSDLVSISDKLVKIDATGYDRIPVATVDSILGDGKGLEITWAGGTFTIPAGTVLEAEDGQIYWTFQELQDLFGKKAALNKKDHIAFISGYPDNTVNPNGNMTRAEVAAMFSRLMIGFDSGKTYASPFSDVSSGAWYANYVGFMEQQGIITGYKDGSFRPNGMVTRAEFAAIAAKFDNLTNANSVSFKDVSASHWAYNAIALAATKGWVSGYNDSTFKPSNFITRAEVVSITCRMLDRVIDKDSIDGMNIKKFTDNNPSSWSYYYMVEATNAHDYSNSENHEVWSSVK